MPRGLCAPRSLAARRTPTAAGAYVLYPGSPKREVDPFKKYAEVLPGVGAFALRPGPDGTADTRGAAAIARFIDDVIEYRSLQTSRLERAQFWERRSYTALPITSAGLVPTPFLRRPPADTTVLLGYVKSVEHRAWIHQHLLYNLRADDRTGSVASDASVLASDLVVLYGPDDENAEVWRPESDPLLLTKAAMEERGYPDPQGELYCCLQLGERLDGLLPRPLLLPGAERCRADQHPSALTGAPVVVSWLELIDA